MIALGLQETTSVVIGNSVGNNDTKLAKKYFKVTIKIVSCLFAVIALVVYLARRPITALFTKEPELQKLSIDLMYILAIKSFFDHMACYLQGVIRGLALQNKAMILSLFVAYIFQTPAAYIFAFTFDMKSAGLWWADAISMFLMTLSFSSLIYCADWQKLTDAAVERIQGRNKEVADTEES